MVPLLWAILQPHTRAHPVYLITRGRGCVWQSNGYGFDIKPCLASGCTESMLRNDVCDQTCNVRLHSPRGRRVKQSRPLVPCAMQTVARIVSMTGAALHSHAHRPCLLTVAHAGAKHGGSCRAHRAALQRILALALAGGCRTDPNAACSRHALASSFFCLGGSTGCASTTWASATSSTITTGKSGLDTSGYGSGYIFKRCGLTRHDGARCAFMHWKPHGFCDARYKQWIFAGGETHDSF